MRKSVRCPPQSCSGRDRLTWRLSSTRECTSPASLTTSRRVRRRAGGASTERASAKARASLALYARSRYRCVDHWPWRWGFARTRPSTDSGAGWSKASPGGRSRLCISCQKSSSNRSCLRTHRRFGGASAMYSRKRAELGGARGASSRGRGTIIESGCANEIF